MVLVMANGKRLDPFVALVVKHCGYTPLGGHVESVSLINTCLAVGARHLALAYLDYLLSGGRPGVPPLSLVPPSLVNRIELVCIIPPEKWFLETFMYEAPVQHMVKEVEFINPDTGDKEEYTVMLPSTFGVVIGYRDYEGDMNYRGALINYTGSEYYAFIVTDKTLEKMLEICKRRGTESYSDVERALLKEDIEKLVEKGFARKKEPNPRSKAQRGTVIHQESEEQ